MFMPKLGTMHLRNSLSFRVVTGILFLILVGSLGAQNSSAPATPPTNQPAAPGQQPSATPQTPLSGQGPTNPGSTTPSPGTQQGPQGQAPAEQNPGQAPSATDNGVFVFHAEAREVTLHATVVDD